MANIIQQPHQYNFAGNLADIILMSDVPVSFSLGEILEEVYHPDSQGRVTIPIRAFFEEHLHAVGLTDISDAGLSIAPYRYSIDGVEVGGIYVLPGGVDSKALDAEMFLRSNFLTWQPNVRSVSYHEPQWLRYVALQSCSVKIKGHFTEGDPIVISLKELSENTQYSLDLNYGRICGMFEKQPTYYDVWVEAGDGERLSFVQRYILRGEDGSGTVDFFVFENSLGGFDSIRFTGERKEMSESESRSAVFDGDTTEYGIDHSRSWQKYTGYIPDERTRVWVLEFFNSAQRYHLSSDSLQRIFVPKQKAEATSGTLSGYEFTFSYSHQAKYMNVERGEFPEHIDIVGTGDPLFFLTPRFNEYPLLDPADDVLLLAQYAYGNSFGVIPASALGGGKGGDGDTVTGTSPIRVDRAGRIVRVSHEAPTLANPESYNRYGNVDKWGHIVSDYHPHGGRADHDFSAQDIIGRAATLSGNVQHPEYVSGAFGNTWGGTAEGDFWLKTLGVRDGITTTELIYNRQSVEGNIKYFTDGVSVEGVSKTAKLVDAEGRQLTTNNDIGLVITIGDGMFHIIPKMMDDDGRTPFRTDDILIGYFRHDNSLLPTATYMRVVSVFGAGEGFTAKLLEGAEPQPHMVLARRGSVSDPARQNSVYIDGKIGKMVFLRGVDSTAIRPYNNAAQLGYIGDVVDANFPDIRPDEVGFYGQNVKITGDLVLSNGRHVIDEFGRVDTSFSVVDGKIEGVVANVGTLDSRLTQEVSTFTQTATDIALSVGSLSIDLNGKIQSSESRIALTEAGILNTVSKDGVISSINQSAEEVRIEASKIVLVGNTTLDGIITLNGKVNADYIDTDNLVVRNLKTSELGSRIEIDAAEHIIRGVNKYGRESFSIRGFGDGTNHVMVFGDSEISDGQTKIDCYGYNILNGNNQQELLTMSEYGLNIADRIGYQRIRLFQNDNAIMFRLLSADTTVILDGLKSKSGAAGNWVPLYINTTDGDIRRQ